MTKNKQGQRLSAGTLERKRTNKALYLLLSVLIISLLILAACGGGTKRTDSQQVNNTKSIAVVYNNQSIGMLPLWVTADAGIFEKYGLDVRLDFARGTLTTDSLIAGQYQIGDASALPVMAAVAKGVDLKITAALFSNLLYGLVVKKDIHSPSELPGKLFGISKIGDSSWTATRMILNKLQVDPNKVTMLEIGNSPERFAALMTGQIDAIIADPMDIVKARREGYPVLADQQQLSLPYVGSVIAMRGEFLKKDPETAMLFLKAISEGIHYYKTHQKETAKIAAKYLNSNDFEAIESAVSVFASTIIPNIPLVLPEAIVPIQEELARTVDDKEVRNLKFDMYVDNSLVQELEKHGFYKQLYGK